MQTGEPNWAEVDGEAAMDYGTLPGLLPDLGPKVGVEEDPALDALDALDLDIDTSNPAVRNFLNNLPSTGPYRIMVTNLPTNITKESLESELSTTYKITATIDYKSSDHYCFLKFTNRSHCLESTSLFGARIHGAAVKLKVRPSDQQAEIRRANTARNNSTRGTLSGSTGGRFKNLTRDGTSSRETKKHRAPVGGSIRKKRSNRNNQSSSHSKPPTNPWNSESRTQPKSDYKILPRGKQPTTNANSRFSRTSGASAAPARGNRDEMRAAPRQNRDFGRRNDRDFGRRNDRDDRRNNDRDDRRNNDRDDRRNNDRNNDRDRGGDRDDAFDFRNRRKLREEDGRSDDALNWRRGGSSSNAPARSRMDRRDPGRATDGAESNFSRRAMNSSSTQNRKSQVQKDKEKEADRAKNRFQNKFALLEEDDD